MWYRHLGGNSLNGSVPSNINNLINLISLWVLLPDTTKAELLTWNIYIWLNWKFITLPYVFAGTYKTTSYLAHYQTYLECIPYLQCKNIYSNYCIFSLISGFLGYYLLEKLYFFLFLGTWVTTPLKKPKLQLGSRLYHLSAFCKSTILFRKLLSVFSPLWSISTKYINMVLRTIDNGPLYGLVPTNLFASPHLVFV